MNLHLKSLASALIFSFLCYSKSLGLNLILIAILAVILVSTAKRDRRLPWLYALVYIVTALFVFLNPTGFTVFVHLMALLVFVGKSISQKSSLHLSWLLGGVSLTAASVINYLQRRDNPEQLKRLKLSPQLINRLKGGLIAGLLLVLFGMLYKSANPVFEGLIGQIDLDFISIPWLLFTGLGYLLFFHLLRPFPARELVDFDLAQRNELERPTELELLGQKRHLQAEHTLGSMVFLALNLLLLVFLVTDVIYLLNQSPISNAGYSQAVHQGVYALLFSAVCAIALILFFFRGHLNFFEGNRRIKLLTYVWIALNGVLMTFTAYKNYTYIEALGLTYKRIGVFVYLVLTLMGLATAYIKVAQLKNFTYLVRTHATIAFALLIAGAAVPWDESITRYNLNTLEKPDIQYLIGLGEANSEQLFRYAKSRSLTIAEQASIEDKYTAFLQVQAQKTWPEYTRFQFVKSTTK